MTKQKFRDRRRPKRVRHNRGELDKKHKRPEQKVMKDVWQDLFGENPPPIGPNRAFMDTVRDKIGAPAYHAAQTVAISQGYFDKGNIVYQCRDGKEIKLPDPRQPARRGLVVLAIYAYQQSQRQDQPSES